MTSANKARRARAAGNAHLGVCDQPNLSCPVCGRPSVSVVSSDDKRVFKHTILVKTHAFKEKIRKSSYCEQKLKVMK